MDFTLADYKHLLYAIKASRFNAITVNDVIVAGNEHTDVIVLRHDVDRKPKNALRMAQLEHSLGIKSTYYFRSKPCSFDRHIINKIASLGHEIGYHYEDYHSARYDADIAIKLFAQNLQRLRQLVNVSTISMHGSPLAKFNNMDLWNYKDFREFNVLDCTQSMDWSSFYYFTDTGRTFSSTSHNLRDYVGARDHPDVSSTKELISFISSTEEKYIKISTHPERWDSQILPWLFQYFKDALINVIKKVITKTRVKASKELSAS